MKLNIKLFEYKNNTPYYDGDILHISKNSQGYCYVHILKKSVRLHRLIAKRYILNKENKPCVDHIDGDKANNNINNLKWVTYSENSKKAFQQNASMKTNKKKVKGIIIISELDGVKKEHRSLRECAKYLDRNVAGVYRCLQGEWNRCNKHLLYYK